MLSIGFIVGSIAAAIVILLCLCSIAFGVRVWKEDDELGRFFVIPGALALLVTLGVAAWGFFPYDMQYHSYRQVQGTVAAVQSRLLGDDKSTTQNYAVQLAENSQTYRCDDTRCSLLHPGNRISLWCIRDWQYAATPGWKCNFDKAD